MLLKRARERAGRNDRSVARRRRLGKGRRRFECPVRPGDVSRPEVAFCLRPAVSLDIRLSGRPGRVVALRPAFLLAARVRKQRRTPDSSGASAMAVDRDGNLYVATRMGVQVADRNGRVRAILTLPEGGVTSLCFGGADFDTLYIVCDGRLYKRKMKLPGVPPLAEPFEPVPRRRGLSSCCDLGTSHGSGIAATGVQQFSDIVQLPVVFALEFQSPVSERGQFYGKPDPGCDRAYQLVTVGSGKAFPES